MNTKGRNSNLDEILGSLDGIRRSAPPDFFYTRLKAKMEKGLLPENGKKWLLRPVYAFAGLLLILALNTAVILQSGQKTETAPAETDIMQSFASEYRINSNLTYEINQ